MLVTKLSGHVLRKRMKYVNTCNMIGTVSWWSDNCSLLSI